MFIVTLLIITKCPPTDEWISKLWYIHTMEYYSAINRNEILTHATIWVSLENIILSERNKSQKATYCMILFIWKYPQQAKL